MAAVITKVELNAFGLKVSYASGKSRHFYQINGNFWWDFDFDSVPKTVKAFLASHQEVMDGIEKQIEEAKESLRITETWNQLRKDFRSGKDMSKWESFLKGYKKADVCSCAFWQLGMKEYPKTKKAAMAYILGSKKAA